MNSTPVLNATLRAFASEAGRVLPHSEKWPAFAGLSQERHNSNFAWRADSRDAATTGFGFAPRGIPLSPLHDV